MQVHGPAGAPPIVLLHGSVVTGAMWAPQVRALASAFRLIVPDLPGHGTAAHVPFTLEGAVDGVVDVMRREAPQGAVVAGLSLGGYVAMSVAARQPAAVRGLVISGASIDMRGWRGRWVRLMAGLLRRGWIPQSRSSLERRVRAMYPPGLAADADVQLAAGLYPEALAPALEALAGQDFRAVLARYPGPVLILNGARDTSACRGAAAFAAAARAARVEQLAGAGHACNVDAADAFTEALRRFALEASGRAG